MSALQRPAGGTTLWEPERFGHRPGAPGVNGG
jgi:hypothetical protein